MPRPPLFISDFRRWGWLVRPGPSQSGFQIIDGPNVTTTTTTSLRVQWTMSAICTGQIEYGTSSGVYDFTTTEQDLDGGYTTHIQTMSGLMADTTYYFRTRSVDGDGNEVYSAEQTQATDAPGGSVSYPTSAALAYRPLVTVTMPAYLAEATDGEFGTKVRRISNVKGQRHNYASQPVWSASGKYLILDKLNNHRALLDASTYAILQDNIQTGTHFVWSPVNDATGWSYSGTSIREYTITDSGYSYVSTNLSQYDEISLGGGEGSPSNDGKYLPLRVRQGSTWGIAVYDTESKSIEADYLAFSTKPNNCTMAWSGDYIVMQGYGNASSETDYANGTWAYLRADLGNPTPTRQYLWWTLSHKDTTRDPTDSFDQVVIPATVDGNAGIYAFRCSDGSYIQLTNYTNRVHVSGRNIHRPGYAYVSSYSVPGEGGNYNWAGYGEVFALKTDGSLFPQAESYAQLHKVLSLDETQASVHPDGHLVIFPSEWSDTGGITDNVYAFVAGVST